MSRIYFNIDHKQKLINALFNHDSNFEIELIEKNNKYHYELIKHTNIAKEIIDIIFSYTHILMILNCACIRKNVNIKMHNTFNIVIGEDTYINWVSEQIFEYYNTRLYSSEIEEEYENNIQKLIDNNKKNINLETSTYNMQINHTLNCYMQYHYNQYSYIDKTIYGDYCKLFDEIMYDEDRSEEDYISIKDKYVLCKYNKQHNSIIQIINIYENVNEFILIKPIDHHKMKRLIIIIKMLSDIIPVFNV